MTHHQLNLLLDYIDAQIDAHLAQRSGYDAATEVERARALRDALSLTIEEPMT